MTKQKMAITIVIAILATLVWAKWPPETVEAEPTVTKVEVPAPTKEELDLKHRKETWISALEWCESRGRNDALNKVDRDGTPSYSNFQWKPTTLLYYGKMYGLVATSSMVANVPELLKNYELQRNVVRAMVDDPKVNWYQQFPDCVKLKVGLPPKR